MTLIEPDPVISDTEAIPLDADTVEEEDAETVRPDTGPAPESPDSEPVEDPEAETAVGTEPAP